MTLALFQIQVETNCRLDVECELMIERLQRELEVFAKQTAQDTANKFGYQVTVSRVEAV